MPLSTTLVFSLLVAPLALGSVISSSFASVSTILLNVSSSLVDPVASSFVGGTPTTLPIASSSFVVPTAVPTAHPSVITIFPSGVCTYPGAAVETVTYVFGPSAVPTAVHSSGAVSSVVFATPSPESSVAFASAASSSIAFLSKASSSISFASAASSSVAFASSAPMGRPFHYGHHFNSTVLEIVLLPSACDNISSVLPVPTAVPSSSIVFESPTPSSVVFETPTPSSVVFETPTPSSVIFETPTPSSVVFASSTPSSS